MLHVLEKYCVSSFDIRLLLYWFFTRNKVHLPLRSTCRIYHLRTVLWLLDEKLGHVFYATGIIKQDRTSSCKIDTFLNFAESESYPTLEIKDKIKNTFLIIYSIKSVYIVYNYTLDSWFTRPSSVLIMINVNPRFPQKKLSLWHNTYEYEINLSINARLSIFNWAFFASKNSHNFEQIF